MPRSCILHAYSNQLAYQRLTAPLTKFSMTDAKKQGEAMNGWIYYISKKGQRNTAMPHGYDYATHVAGPYLTREQAELERLWTFGVNTDYCITMTGET